MIIGTSMGQEICLIIVQVSISLLCYSIKRETSQTDIWVWGETDKTAADIQARSFLARTLDEIGKKCPAEGEAKVVR